MDDVEARVRELAEAFGHWPNESGLWSAGWALVDASRNKLPMMRWQYILMSIATSAIAHSAGRPVDMEKLSQVERLLDVVPGPEVLEAARAAIAALKGTKA